MIRPASLPPCLPASLPRCLPASLPPCLSQYLPDHVPLPLRLLLAPLSLRPCLPALRTKAFTPEIATSEIIMDFQWYFPMDFQWHFPTGFHLPVALSKGLSDCHFSSACSLPPRLLASSPPHLLRPGAQVVRVRIATDHDASLA